MADLRNFSGHHNPAQKVPQRLSFIATAFRDSPVKVAYPIWIRLISPLVRLLRKYSGFARWSGTPVPACQMNDMRTLLCRCRLVSCP